MFSFVFGITFLAVWMGWGLRVTFANPEVAKLRIKRDLEGERKRVLDIRRRGGFSEGRGLRYFRTYEVTTEERGWKKERRLAVEAVWFSDAEVRHYDDCWQEISGPGTGTWR